MIGSTRCSLNCTDTSRDDALSWEHLLQYTGNNVSLTCGQTVDRVKVSHHVKSYKIVTFCSILPFNFQFLLNWLFLLETSELCRFSLFQLAIASTDSVLFAHYFSNFGHLKKEKMFFKNPQYLKNVCQKCVAQIVQFKPCAFHWIANINKVVNNYLCIDMTMLLMFTWCRFCHDFLVVKTKNTLNSVTSNKVMTPATKSISF